MYRGKTNVGLEMYDNSSYKWIHWNSNEVSVVLCKGLSWNTYCYFYAVNGVDSHKIYGQKLT
jgi:hypothetical protein